MSRSCCLKSFAWFAVLPLTFQTALVKLYDFFTTLPSENHNPALPGV